MVSFKINLEEMSRVRALQNETLRKSYEMQRNNTILVETNCSKTIDPFHNLGNITLTS